MLAILAVGRDTHLLSTRADVLRQCNAGVISASPSAAPDLLKTQRFDLVVLCHTLSSEDMNRLAVIARQQASDVQVLEVINGVERIWSQLPSAADDTSQAKPETLVAKVMEMLGEPIRAH